MRSPSDPTRSAGRCRALIIVLLGFLLPVTAPAQEEAQSAAGLVLEAVMVEPGAPGPETLCKLTAKVRNEGEKTASQLDFKVKINGQDLPVYRNQLFMYPVAPGTTAEVRLYNFWSTETSRPAPADGKLVVEVSLVEAQWMRIENDEEGVEVWTPLGAVEGLPSSRTETLQLTKG